MSLHNSNGLLTAWLEPLIYLHTNVTSGNQLVCSYNQDDCPDAIYLIKRLRGTAKESQKGRENISCRLGNTIDRWTPLVVNTLITSPRTDVLLYHFFNLKFKLTKVQEMIKCFQVTHTFLCVF